jgi:hypothetical protein
MPECYRAARKAGKSAAFVALARARAPPIDSGPRTHENWPPCRVTDTLAPAMRP